jgi:polar amino acid transport system substrate-binding protein
MKIQNLLFGLVFSLAVAVQAAEKVTVVAEDDWYPFCGNKGGKPEGMAVDIVREAFKAAGVEVTFKLMPYSRCMEETKKGTEVGCFDTVRLPEYDASYLFTKEQLFEAEIGIFAPSTYKGPEGLKVKDLEGKTVGITNSYEYGAEFGANNKIKKDLANSDLLSMRKLAGGRVEFALYYTKVAESVMKENKADLGGKVKSVGTVTVDKLYLAFSKAHKDGQKFTDLLDKGLTEIKKNGTYKKIQDDWAKKLQ